MGIAYPKITCRVCGIEVARLKTAGRPRKTHQACMPKSKSKFEMMINTEEPGDEPNFVRVSGGPDEFWNAMAAKALMRRAAEQR